MILDSSIRNVGGHGGPYSSQPQLPLTGSIEVQGRVEQHPYHPQKVRDLAEAALRPKPLALGARSLKGAVWKLHTSKLPKWLWPVYQGTPEREP